MKSDDVNNKFELTNEFIIGNILVRLTALENMLVSSGVINADELAEEISNMTESFMRSMLQHVKSPEDIEKIIAEFKNGNKMGN